MLKLPKGLKKKKKKSKKDQELFTEEELEQYKREQKAKQEAAAAKSDVGESDGASDVESPVPGATTSTVAAAAAAAAAHAASTTTTTAAAPLTVNQTESNASNKKSEEDEEWAKFKALTSGVDSIVHKTQEELDRIKKESFYQRLPSAAEKKRQEEEEAAKREAARLEEERRRAAEFEAQRDKLAEAVVELSESEGEASEEIDDIFVTDHIEALAKGEIPLAVVPDSPEFDFDDGPDPFDTAYAEKVIVGANKAKGDKKLVSLGAAVEVLSGRVDREHAVALAKPKRKLRKGIQNLLLSDSVDLADSEIEIVTPEPQKNLLDELVDDVPEPEAPIDLSVSLHLHLIHPKKLEEEEDGEVALPDLSEFDSLKEEEDDEFAELAAESLIKKEEVQIITEIPLPKAEVLTEISDADWAEFEQTTEELVPESKTEITKAKPVRPPPPTRPATGPHIVPGAIYISDEDDDFLADDPFNTTYAEVVIKKTTVLEEDDDFDPRAEEIAATANTLAQPTRDLLGGSATDLSKVGPAPIAPTQEGEPEDFDPFDTSAVSAIVLPKATELKFIEQELLPESILKHSLSDPDFDPRADELETLATTTPFVEAQSNSSADFDTARRKSSLSLNIQSKTVGFVVPDQDLLGASNGNVVNKKPVTPYYAPKTTSIEEKEIEDPFNTAFATEDLLFVKENINIKVLTPAQESKDLPEGGEEVVDPFDTSIAANLGPGKAELRLLESELLPESKKEIATGVLDTQTDAQELGLGGKVLTPQLPAKQLTIPEDIDPFDTSIAENLAPGKAEIKILESELIER